MVEFNEDKQTRKLDELRRREEEELMHILSSKYSIPYADLGPIAVDLDALRVVTADVAKDAQAAVFNKIDKRVQIGIRSPNNPKTQALLLSLKERGYLVEPFLVSQASLEKVWGRYEDLSFSFETKSGALDISSEEINAFLSKTHSIDDIRASIAEVLKLKKGYRISRILEIVVAGSLALNASDIHIEPQENFIRLRYRLDGVLLDILELDKETYDLLLSRIKLLSGLKLNLRDVAQDGRFSIDVQDMEIEIRTSLLPGAYAESVVLRILNPKSISVPLEELGLHPLLLERILKEITKPNGMLLTTGPTGSGKTTTLYAFMKKVYTPEIKIITIENPIEYHLAGIVQTQTDSKKGYTFNEGLRSALRQDPDVIMVGEIRDGETAETAINAALTGHLVFSTLHTNNAAGTFPRLIDLGVNSNVISSAINVTMAQRLVRKLHPTNRKQIPLEGEHKALVEKYVASITDKRYLEGVDLTHEWVPSDTSLPQPEQYKGRIGIFEAIFTDQKIEEVIQMNSSEREIEKVAKEDQHMITLAEDAILKIMKGETTFEEVARVVEL